MKGTKLFGAILIGALLPATAWAGFGDSLKAKLGKAKESVSCDNDHGVEQAGKDMDGKAYNALIAAETALEQVAEAAGKADIAKTAKANLDKWKNPEKAPSGLDRMKEISKASDSIQHGADAVGGMKLDEKGKKSLLDARGQLRMAVVYVAWGAKIGEPVPANAKDAIAANKACSAKVKGPADAAAGLSSLSTKIKATYAKVSDAAKKAGAPEMTEQEMKEQDSKIGAPAGLASL